MFFLETYVNCQNLCINVKDDTYEQHLYELRPYEKKFNILLYKTKRIFDQALINNGIRCIS